LSTALQRKGGEPEQRDGSSGEAFLCGFAEALGVCKAGLLWASHTRAAEAELFSRCKAAVREPEVQ